MGLEDGRLRVVNADVIARLATGQVPPEDRHSFSVEIGEAVLALETMRVAPAREAFVLAMLRDHSVHLFKVDGLDEQLAAVDRVWKRHVFGDQSIPGLDAEQESQAHRSAAEALLRASGAPSTVNARHYLVAYHVLSRLQKLAADREQLRFAAIDLAVSVAGRANDRVLRALTHEIGGLARGDVDCVLRLSEAILRGLARYRNRAGDSSGALVPIHGRAAELAGRRSHRWGTAISGHLGQLHRLAREAKADDRARLVAWARFVRKYIVRGHTFTAKRLALGPLVEQNHGNTKYFDALIYQALLAKRCYDLQWEQAATAEVAHLHPFARLRVTAVVAVDATIRFVGPNGELLDVHDTRAPAREECHEPTDRRQVIRPPGVIAPFDLWAQEGAAWPARRRTLASAAVLIHQGIRIVLAAEGEALRPAGLVVVDVLLGRNNDGVTLLRIRDVQCSDSSARVHALHALPSKQVFVVGLESPEHPVGRLWDAGHTKWTLELARERSVGPDLDDGKAKDSELSSVAPGKLPTRALAVGQEGDRYLVVAGSDDGQVRVFSCNARDSADHWLIERWHQMTSAVTSIALGSHEKGGPGEPVFSCYVSTASGETLAVSIVVGLRSEHTRFGDYDAHPLWRETHDSAVVAMSMWDTQLYAPSAHATQAVLAVATRNGRLILYNHACFDKYRVSMAKNYWFRGKRLERLTLPTPLATLALPSGSRDVIAAAPGGDLYAARLVFLRDTDERDDQDPPDVSSQKYVQSSDVDAPLPGPLWSRLRHLLERSDVDWVFRRESREREECKLKLCELVPIDAVVEFALRQQLDPSTAWAGLNASAITRRAHELLDGLSPERPQEAARIKIILKGVSRQYLLRTPDDVAKVVLEQRWPRHEETAAACEIVSEYLTNELARSTPATARLRVVAIKELLRVGLLHHMARRDETSKRIADAVERAFAACMRDDERVVRIEALRALSVMLRNVRLMEEKKPGVVERLFPEKLGSITWAIDLVVERLARFPVRRDASALVSGAWYRISVIVHIFRLFPGWTLALCDHVTRARRGDDVVRHCHDLLQRPGASASAITSEEHAQRRLTGPVPGRWRTVHGADVLRPDDGTQ